MKYQGEKTTGANKKTFYVLRSTFYDKRGFVALFAMLISSIVLTISFGLLNVALKEVILSSSGRESQFGFYAADAGAECALYWDVKGFGGFASVFPTSTASQVYPNDSGINCGTMLDGVTPQDITTDRRSVLGSYFEAMTYNRGASSATSTFYLSVVPVAGKACARVDVAKSANSTKIEAYGYNTCNFNSPRVIERAIRISY